MIKSTLFKAIISVVSLFLFVLPSGATQVQDPSKIPVEAFAKQPTISRLRLSPHGDAIAMRTIMDNQPVMVVQNLDGSNRKYIGPRDKYELASFYWVNNDDLLVLYRFDKSSGNKTMRFAVTKLYGFNRQSGDFKELFIPDARYRDMMWNRVPFGQNNFISWLHDDPDHIMMSATNGNEEYPPVFKLNIHTGARETVQIGKRNIWDWRADRHDEVRLGVGTNWDTGEELIIYKNAAGEWVDVSRDLGYGFVDDKYQFFGFDDTSDALIISAVSKYGTYGIYKYDLDQQKIIGTLLENETYDVTRRLQDNFTKNFIGYAYFSDTIQPFYTDPLYMSVYKQVNAMLNGAEVNIVMKARTINRFLIYADSERLPGMYFMYDHDTKQLNPIAPIQPEIDSRIMASYQSISYEARDGLTIHGYLTLPVGKEAKNLPVVVWPHGGPQSRTVKEYSAFVQFFVSRGYAVLQPNFRGSTGYGVNFNRAMRGEWGGKMQDDVTDGTNWLIKQGIADPERICIGGISYGGYAAAMGVIKEPDLYKCAISVNGVLDFKDLIRAESGYMKQEHLQNYLKVNNLLDIDQKAISPVYLVNKVQVPMLLISAKDDLTVNWEQARDMHKAMSKNGKDSEYISLDEGRHSMETLKSRKTAMEAMEKFLAKHIGN